ncbi:DENN domain-containing protein 1B [Collichthys lucidus]|uniref:DENN domain-containing protein 1B n=1 Tax=Collichthys lucidus TaxID=240159 RepID=A0A4V6AQ97_COLLU|nr:DENN domain-containing protein 1B [Collichthys lucidus]
MGSRLKQNPERTFYWFFEATCPVTTDNDPGVQFQFPEDFSDEESSQTLPRFCFPYDIQRVRDGVVVQHFTFVLTDLEGCQRFGFCRLTNSTHTCLCILSYLPWFEVFYKLLNNLADYLTKGQTNELKALLAALYKQPIPLAAGSVTLQMIPYFIAPDPRSLPSIPENRNLTELIVAVDVGNLLQLYASMLFERRILIFASKLSTLTSCVHALSAVLYPMYWQHIFIPVLPPHLLDYCCAPMPYLIGVHTSLSERVRSRGLEEVVILNVDTNTLETPFDDLKRIPSDVMAGLKVCLKRQAVSPGCGVSKAFLKAQALLFGGYRDALQEDKEGEMWFSEELFLDHKSSSMRQFLQSAIHLQSFKQAKGLAMSGLKNLLLHKAHNEEHALQRGGSVSHRRAKSDCLQNRLPITQHFGKSRPRRPVHKHRDPREEEDTNVTGDTWDGAVSQPVVKPDSQLQKDEEEGEESLLCDPEEMDLLGEIFDTLSSRSSHERGLLYGTRSLDLFAPDSHDYITKRGFPANPSQESLSLSISGSGSLHSWNLETTEELSDLTEDSDWLCLDTSVPEEEVTHSPLAACETGEQESMQREVKQKQEEVNVTVNGNQEEEIDNRNDFKKVKAEEGRKTDGPEKRMRLGEDPMKETAGKREDEELKEKREEEQSMEGQETEGGINKMLQGVSREEEQREDQKEKDREVTVSLNKLTEPYLHLPEKQQEQDGLKPTASHGPQTLTEEPSPLAGQKKSSEEAVKKEEQEIKQTPSPPKVLSAAVRFQSQAHSPGLWVKSRAKELAEPRKPCNMFRNRENAQTHPPCDSNISEDNNRSEVHEEEEMPSIKVSELKKRFEA